MSTLQENLSLSNSRTGKLERSLEQCSHRECMEIAEIPRDIPHVIFEAVLIKLLNKTDVDLNKKVILWLATD